MPSYAPVSYTHLDVYKRQGQIQANAHALLFVYFFLPIEAPEDGGMIAFRNALAGVGHFDLHIHFPQHHQQMCIRDRRIYAVLRRTYKEDSPLLVLDGCKIDFSRAEVYLSLIHI